MGITALPAFAYVPGHREGGAFNQLSGHQVADLITVLADDRVLAVVQRHGIAGEGDEGVGVGADEVLLRTDAYHQRALQPHGIDVLRIVGGKYKESVTSLESTSCTH